MSAITCMSSHVRCLPLHSVTFANKWNLPQGATSHRLSCVVYSHCQSGFKSGGTGDQFIYTYVCTCTGVVWWGTGGTRPPTFQGGGQHRNCPPPHFSVQIIVRLIAWLWRTNSIIRESSHHRRVIEQPVALLFRWHWWFKICCAERPIGKFITTGKM